MTNAAGLSLARQRVDGHAQFLGGLGLGEKPGQMEKISHVDLSSWCRRAFLACNERHADLYPHAHTGALEEGLVHSAGRRGR